MMNFYRIIFIFLKEVRLKHNYIQNVSRETFYIKLKKHIKRTPRTWYGVLI